MEKLLEQKVDALAVAPIDSDYVPEYLDDIRENKITAITFDNGFFFGAASVYRYRQSQDWLPACERTGKAIGA